MRVLLCAATLFVAPTLAHADEGALIVGVAGGVTATDPLEVIGDGFTVVPRIGFEFRENAIVELDVAAAFGNTRGQEVGYTAISPTLNFRGILIDTVPTTDEFGNVGSKRSPVQPYLTVGMGVMVKNVSEPELIPYSFPNPDVDFLATAGPGVQFPLGSSLMLRTDYKILANFGTERFNNHGDTMIDWQWTAGLDFLIGGGKDTDGDGINDNRDQCITDAEDFDGFADADGCPDDDNDGDGIADTIDACPTGDDAAEDFDGFADEDGCPELDNDEDGILDEEDRCPVDAGKASAQGCPDEDEDGIADGADSCPTLAGPAELQGCPDTDGDTVVDPEDECVDVPGPVASFGCPDGDEDLVPDFRDECPDEKANEGINPKRSDGCPSRVFVSLDGITITEKVYFNSGRATIQSRSYGLLNDVATTLNAYPEILKIEVQGHTDSQGNDDSNMTLSQNRASAVVLYLSEHGVDASRLVAQGYGETEPVDTNDTSAGRANNRRVQFKILEEEQRLELRRVDELEEGDEVVPVDEAEGVIMERPEGEASEEAEAE